MLSCIALNLRDADESLVILGMSDQFPRNWELCVEALRETFL